MFYIIQDTGNKYAVLRHRTIMTLFYYYLLRTQQYYVHLLLVINLL